MAPKNHTTSLHTDELPTTLNPHLLPASPNGIRFLLYRLMFHHESWAERWFDIGLIVAILMSVLVAMADSVGAVHVRHAGVLFIVEISFTVVFTIEYALRLWCLQKPMRYVRSFYGLIDLFSVLPMYLAFVFQSAQLLIVVRVLRVLRVFRILEMARYQSEASVLISALHRSRRKIVLFVVMVLSLATIFGALMYLVEGPERGFTSIPRGIYWAIVTMATVGFGDITPKTPLGQFITTIIIIIGYGIIAVPTGIYSAELVRDRNIGAGGKRACGRGGESEHAMAARYCQRCGERLIGGTGSAPPSHSSVD